MKQDDVQVLIQCQAAYLIKVENPFMQPVHFTKIKNKFFCSHLPRLNIPPIGQQDATYVEKYNFFETIFHSTSTLSFRHIGNEKQCQIEKPLRSALPKTILFLP